MTLTIDAVSAMTNLDKLKLWDKQIKVTPSKHTIVQMPKEGQPVSHFVKARAAALARSERLFVFFMFFILEANTSTPAGRTFVILAIFRNHNINLFYVEVAQCRLLVLLLML